MGKVRLLTVGEVAERLTVSRQTAWRWIQVGMIHFRQGRIIRVPETALERFIEQKTEYPTCLKGSGKRKVEQGSTGTRGSGCPTECSGSVET